MTALKSLKNRLKEFEIKYEYNSLFSYEENRGACLTRLIDQAMGNYVEESIPEWDPDPKAKHLGVGFKIDWENSKVVVEQKKNPQTDNGSSRKSNLLKLKESAEEKGKTPIYAYWEDRRKNDYMKDGVRHLHGIAIFKFLGIEDQWEDFLSHINDVRLIIKEELTKKFDEHYKSPINTSV
tara:strand:+ start:109 stop:648 length:540 start_codon:yes stop_codon:yes gene_type:complete